MEYNVRTAVVRDIVMFCCIHVVEPQCFITKILEGGIGVVLTESPPVASPAGVWAWMSQDTSVFYHVRHDVRHGSGRILIPASITGIVTD